MITSLQLTRNVTVLLFTCVVITTVAAQTKQSDRAFDGLLGSVKSVSTEIAEAKRSGDVIEESNRRMQQFREYDLEGNRTLQKDCNWLSGLVTDIVEYKRVNGDRIAFHIAGEKPGMIITSVPQGLRKSNSKDSRVDYTETVKFRYDDVGQVVEEIWHQDDGSIWLRYVYNRKGNEVEELVYDKNGKLNQKYISTYDDKGNLTEKLFFDTDTGKPDGREICEYIEFDRKGNWTKMLTYEAGLKKDSNRKPRDFHYRKITYF